MTGKPKINQRGAATVEAVCALFVFVLLWAGVLYMGGLYRAQLQSESQARGCAWMISMGACRVEVEGCRSTAGGNERESRDAKLREPAKEFEDGNAVEKAIGERLMAQLNKLFGKRATAKAGQDVPRPALLGGKSVAVGADYNLPCNTKPGSIDGLAKEMLKGLVKKK